MAKRRKEWKMKRERSFLRKAERRKEQDDGRGEERRQQQRQHGASSSWCSAKDEEEEETREKEENASGDRFLLDARPRTIKSLSMVGGVIKDPRLRPCELSEKRTKKKPASERKKQTKKKKKKKKKKKNRKNIAGVGPGRPRRRLRLRGRGKKAREPAGQRMLRSLSGGGIVSGRDARSSPVPRREKLVFKPEVSVGNCVVNNSAMACLRYYNFAVQRALGLFAFEYAVRNEILPGNEVLFVEQTEISDGIVATITRQSLCQKKKETFETSRSDVSNPRSAQYNQNWHD
ncbi:hypothetical protein WN51_10389 [Melipona quadrifasciata]|uniref:Uncharacterized protein n=1 Tax=Melipona quadrifasciata TaxID=166423 RepID=A0A0M9A4D8_9HYME|nr:hypothetical protein WN51_10389 [Melipona quadrifasciata]